MTTPATTLAVLSVRQPWAHAIFHQGKNVENRTWSTRYRGRLAIHTGATTDRSTLPAMLLGVPPWPPADPNLPPLTTGALLGSVELLDVHHATTCRLAGPCARWGEPGVWHWVLTDPRPLTYPIACPGQRGLYRIPATVLEPRCPECRCNPYHCDTDESGDHCTAAGCNACLEGCPLDDCPTCGPTVPASVASGVHR